jgi:hypothetical protein
MANENAVGIIPDSISARSVSGIITMLSSANIVSEGDVAST